MQTAWQRLSRNLTEIVSLNESEGIFVINDYPCPALLIRTRAKDTDQKLFKRLYKAMNEEQEATDEEPMMNIISWRTGDNYNSVVFPRRKHRPDCYTAEGDQQYIISPGALDMGGLMITPRQEDFERITAEKAFSILREVSVTQEELQIIVERLKDVDSKPQTSNLKAARGQRRHCERAEDSLRTERTLCGQRSNHRGRTDRRVQRGRHPVERQPVSGADLHTSAV